VSEPNSDTKRPVVDPVTGLLPCPFCGSTKVRILKTHPPYGSVWRDVECVECLAGLGGHGEAEAKIMWNRRTP
jgi:hypothetical protein